MLHVRTAFETGLSHISIEISDTGKGISPEYADKIFQPFFTTKPKGTGLGLAISKQLIEQHGGSITAAGNPSGGAIFGIQLPLKSPPGEMTT
jgi:signal transduction histidine kinase